MPNEYLLLGVGVWRLAESHSVVKLCGLSLAASLSLLLEVLGLQPLEQQSSAPNVPLFRNYKTHR